MKQLKVYLLFPLYFCINIAIAQELVPNGGFESFSVCPVGFSEFEGKVDEWQNPNTASPDYMDACANPLPAGVPVNGIGWQLPHSGVAYAGMYAFSGTLYREFIQVQLLAPLTAGSEYAFEMYVVLHNKSNTAIDDIGAYFSSAAPFAAGTGVLSGSPLPQISNPPASVITDTLNWTLISGTYTATGGEQYITLGHFKSDAATTYLPVPGGTVGAYYYYDDISLQEISVLPVNLLSFTATLQEYNGTPFTELHWSTASEINNCCFYISRSEDGQNFTDIGKIEGELNSNTIRKYSFNDAHPRPGINYYRLRQQDVNGVSSSSEIISVINSMPAITVDVNTSLHEITLYNAADHDLKASLYSITSGKEGELILHGGSVKWQVSVNKKGIFILEIIDPANGSQLAVKKILLL